MVGRKILHYELLEKLGEGGMGAVWKAQDIRLRKTVALKFLSSESTGDTEIEARMEREAQAAAALDHPNICPVYGLHEHDGETFIAMAFVDGPTLQEKIKERPLPSEEAIEIAIQIAEGLQEAHEKGVVHRDIKPGNVMLTAKGRVKITDFGLALVSHRTRLTRPDTSPGTPLYMAPEQVTGRGADRRSDIWALGCVLYEMLTQRAPFEEEYEQAVSYSILNEEPEPVTALRAGLPPEIDRILSRALAKQGEQRYQYVDDLLVDLRKLRNGGGTPPAPSPDPEDKAVVKWWLVGALAAVLVAAAGYFVGSTGLEGADSSELTIRPLTAYAGYEGMATFSPDGSLMAYTHSLYGSMDLFVRPVMGGEPSRLTDHAADETVPSWSPDGRYVAFVSDRGGGGEVFLIAPTGGPERSIAAMGLPRDLVISEGLGGQPWSPQGDELLFTKASPGADIAVWAATPSGDQRQVTFPPPGAADWNGSWSFNGERIVFERREAGRSTLLTMPVSGGDPTVLVESGQWPVWTPDDERILYSSNRGGAVNIWEVDIASKRLRQLTRGPSRDGHPIVASNWQLMYDHFSHQEHLYLQDLESSRETRLTFNVGLNLSARISPAGDSIVYQSDQSGNNDIWLLNLESGAARSLTSDPGEDTQPDWSPDGDRVVYRSNRGGTSSLWVMNADGSGAERLIPHDLPAPSISMGGQVSGIPWTLAPRWSPDGEAIGFLGAGPGGLALWVADLEGELRQLVLSAPPISFDWYRDSRHVVYTRFPDEDSTEKELVVAELDSGKEEVLARGPIAEIATAPDGSGLTFSQALSHFDQNLFLLPLESSESGLPRPGAEPSRLTDGAGLWHVHNGGWSRDNTRVVYSRDTDECDLFLIESYR